MSFSYSIQVFIVYSFVLIPLHILIVSFSLHYRYLHFWFSVTTHSQKHPRKLLYITLVLVCFLWGCCIYLVYTSPTIFTWIHSLERKLKYSTPLCAAIFLIEIPYGLSIFLSVYYLLTSYPSISSVCNENVSWYSKQ